MAEPFTSQSDGIRFSVCGVGDVPEMNRLLAEVFTRDDPPAVAVGLRPNEFEAFVGLISRSTASDGLTIIARDIATGDMAGALLAEDAKNPPPEGIDTLPEKFGPIFDLFGQLDDQIGEDSTVALGELLHLFLLGVDQRFARRRVGQRLVTASLANGAERGYRMAVTEATNRVSQHIFGKLGFVGRAEVSYADYRRHGEPVFASIAEHGGPMSMSRDISAAG